MALMTPANQSLWQGHSGPLKGVRVLDIATVIAGPFAASLLADFGAEVIKVEQPGVGDPSRTMGPFAEGESLRYPALNRNKKGITLDLRRPSGADLFRRLCSKSDLVIENFRPGTLERWGLGPEELRRENPNLILVRISGYGQTGPYRENAGFGTPATAFSGLTYLLGYEDRPPLNMPISFADLLAGLFAAWSAVLSLYWRDARGGAAQDADVSLYESVFRMLDFLAADYSVTGRITERQGGFKGSACPAGTYRTGDGRWVVLVCSTDRTFNRLAEVMGRPDLITDPRFCTNSARLQHRDELDQVITAWIGSHDWEPLREICREGGVPIDPVNTIADIFADPQYQARESIVQVDHPLFGKIAMPGLVPKLSETPGQVVHGGPGLGAHNSEIFGNLLDISEAELDTLREAGVI
ncbi:MAG TPA: CoA transferase [Symbiobacteriaceae bacterium]|jgi:formyl-CoA transferase